MNLSNKKILFVDDRPDSVVGFCNEVNSNGAITTIRRSINSAVVELRTNPYDLVIIDLFLPNNHNKLNSYRDIEINGRNQGELLACYLKTRENPIPYLYLTSQRDFYTGTETDCLFTKSATQIAPFIAKILAL